MPEPTPPTNDDPFADLFGRLPDPRTRSAGSAAEPSRGSAPEGERPAASAGETASTGETASAGETASTAPLSRRAAREAAAGTPAEPAATAPAPVSPENPADAGETSAAAPPAPPVAADTASTTAPPTAAFRASAAPVPPASQAEPVVTLTDDSPARPYARSAGSLDDLFSGSTSTDDIGAPPPPKNKRKRRIGGWIALGIVLLLLGGVAAGGWYVWTTYEDKIREFMGWEEPKDFEEGLAHGEALITIITGDNGQSISRTLFDAGVTKTPEAFYEYLVDTDQNPPFVPGVFSLQLEMSSAAALTAILDPANKLENSALLREGLTVEQSLVILSESLGIPLEDFQAAVVDPTQYGVALDPAVAAAGGQPLEGWLFPATYEFDPGVTATDVIGRLVTKTQTVLGQLGVPEEDRQRILTTASIIQREARYEQDMQMVARVILNRLDPAISDTNALLQMDSTAQFGYGEMHDGTVSSSGEALRDDNPWNTYVHPGLPVGPIANPGETAIAAAMSPADGDWQYFVTVNLETGETIFTSNLADHNRAVAQWQQWCRDNPDGGC